MSAESKKVLMISLNKSPVQIHGAFSFFYFSSMRASNHHKN